MRSGVRSTALNVQMVDDGKVVARNISMFQYIYRERKEKLQGFCSCLCLSHTDVYHRASSTELEL